MIDDRKIVKVWGFQNYFIFNFSKSNKILGFVDSGYANHYASKLYVMTWYGILVCVKYYNLSPSKLLTIKM